ncbi:hypothetical protein ACFX2C_006773 [Malus domestica]
MNLRHLISRQVVNNASKISGTLQLLHAFTTIATDLVPLYFRPPGYGGSKPLKNPSFPKPVSLFHRYIHSAQAQAQAVDSEQEEDGAGSCGSCDRSSPNRTRDLIRQPSTACC